MYCEKCGMQLSDDAAFCSRCGLNIAQTKAPPAEFQKAQLPPTAFQMQAPPQMNDVQQTPCMAYVDQKIRETTTFINAQAFIDGAKPLKWRWLPILLGGIVTIPVLGMGALIVWLVTDFAAGAMLTKLNLKQYQLPQGLQVDLDDLTQFLSANLSSLPVTAWQRGNPSTFGLQAENLEVVECLFRGKTYHRIMFDRNHPGVYKIMVFTSTGKERLKNGGGNNPVVLYKAHYLLQPILAAAMEYYINSK